MELELDVEQAARERKWFRIEIRHNAPEVGLEFDSSEYRSGVVPLLGEKTTYLVKVRKPARQIRLRAMPKWAASDLTASAVGARTRDFVALFMRLLRNRDTKRVRLPGNDVAYVLRGSNQITRAELNALLMRYRERNRDERLSRRLQISDFQCAEFYPNIDDDWKCLHHRQARVSENGASDVAVYVHLFYPELWPDFCFGLQNFEFPFDLHISLSATKILPPAEISAKFPRVQFHQVENRGRDIWPFIDLLQSGAFDGYSTVCKLHSKTSDHLRRAHADVDIGRRWRRSAILELMGTRERIERAVKRFRVGSSAGIIGPSNLRIKLLQSDPVDEDWGTEKNRPTMKALAHRLGIPAGNLETDFFAGTMFWFSPQALAAIREAQFQADDFEPEPLPKEGALPHGFERMFNLIAKNAGFEILETREV